MATVTCPGCGKRGKFPPHFVGKLIKCRDCGSRFTAAADAADMPEAPSGSLRPPAFDLQTPASKQEVLEPLILEEPEADQPANCGINLAQPADSGIDLEKKPVIGHQTFQTYLSAINAYMARKGLPSSLTSSQPAGQATGWGWKLVASATASLVVLIGAIVTAAVFWPRPKPVEAIQPVALTAQEVFDQASPAVVSIEVFGKSGQRVGQGSGFLVSADGLVVTNFHVISDAYSAEVVFKRMRIRVEGMAGAQEPDLALLKVSGQFPTLELADDAMPARGTRVFAIGAPQGLPDTISEGIISGHRSLARGSSGTFEFLQTDAPISPGSSGGPLLSDRGKVVGVTTLSRVDGQNLNFAIPTWQVRKLVSDHRPPVDLAVIQERIRSKSPFVEVTETDIVQVEDFSSDKAKCFGVALGMSKKQVLDAINERGGLTVVVRKDEGREFWFVRRKTDKPMGVGLQWDQSGELLSGFTIGHEHKEYLVGDARRLLTKGKAWNADLLLSLGTPTIIRQGDKGLLTTYIFKERGIVYSYWNWRATDPELEDSLDIAFVTQEEIKRYATSIRPK